MQKIKIAYVINDISKTGGAEQQIYNILENIDREKFEPFVISLRGKGHRGREVEKMGFKVYALNRNLRLYGFRKMVDMFKIFKLEKPDIMHSFLFVSNTYGRLAAVFAGVPVKIISEQNIYADKKRRFGLPILIDKFLAKFTCKIIAVSEGVKNFTINQEGIKNDKIRIIYNGINPERFKSKASNKNIRKEFGIADKISLIVCVASLTEQKNHDMLLKGFALAKNELNAKLLIVGDGEKRHKLKSFTEKLGIKEDVIFTGNRTDVPDILKTSDIFALTSHFEGLPVAIIEAMVFGLPVVGTDVYGINEAVIDGYNGFLVSLTDSNTFASRLVELCQAETLKEKMSRNAKKTVDKKFSSDIVVRRQEDLYEQCLG